MRRIYISSSIKKIARDYSNNIFSKRSNRFKSPQKELNKILKNFTQIENDYRKYIEKIIKEYNNILSATPSEMIKLIIEFDNLKVNLNKKIFNNLSFYESIINAMRYDALREIESLPYLKKSGIKTCVYCNFQFVIIADNSSNNKTSKTKAFLELDHYYPKSAHPFLCTSFFNLYPVCSNCNKAKSDKKIKFQLYTEDSKENLNPFRFEIDDVSLAKYKTDKRHEDLRITFKNINANSIDDKTHNDVFCIEGIYNTQKDIAEELIIKSEIYTKSYKKSLTNSFKEALCDETIINRMLIGNYDSEKDIHKRPLAKFTQDIAKQLGLI